MVHAEATDAEETRETRETRQIGKSMDDRPPWAQGRELAAVAIHAEGTDADSEKRMTRNQAIERARQSSNFATKPSITNLP